MTLLWLDSGLSQGWVLVLDVVVVGAGAAGLAVGACLRRRGIDAVILEREDSVGSSWRHRYDRLHLHTPRIQSQLPGSRIPGRYGRWVSRDDYVAYLEDYCRHQRLSPRFGVEVQRVDRPTPGTLGWRVRTAQGTRDARAVVMATGYHAVPHVPAWPGLTDYTRPWLHASGYRNGAPYIGREVLVVGAGNTGAEIAVDLVEHGAARVLLAVRSAPHVVPRTVAGVPTTLLGIPNQFLPAWMGDPVNRLMQRMTIGNLDRYGLPTPDEGLIARFRRSGAVPIIDVGLVRHLRSGRVVPVPAVVSFTSQQVLLADGRHLRVDAVIAATGYRTELPALVGHLGVLDDDGRNGRPSRPFPQAAGLHLVGLRNPLIGVLNAISLDARRVARAVDRELRVEPRQLAGSSWNARTS